jgi:hypothetical protein
MLNISLYLLVFVDYYTLELMSQASSKDFNFGKLSCVLG